MQVREKKSKRKRVSSPSLSNIEKRRAGKQKSFRRRGLCKGATTSTSRPNNPFTLKAADKILSGLHVAVLQGQDSPFANPAEQLKALNDLYPVVSKLPKFKEKRGWTIDSSPSDILHDMLIQFDNMQTFENWEIELIEGKYSINGLFLYREPDPYWITADFLPKINHSHPELHELAIYAFMMVSRYNHIDLYDDWVKTTEKFDYNGMTYEMFKVENEPIEEDPDNNQDELHLIELCKNYYGPKGLPAAYLKIMKGGVSLKIYEEKLKRYHNNDKISQVILPFLHQALVIAKTKISMLDYCHEPFESGELTPNNYLRIIWSYEDNDLMWQCFARSIDDWAQNGVSPFCWKCSVNELTQTNMHLSFLDELIKFFEVGSKMSQELIPLLKGAPEQLPKPIKKKKQNGRLIDILV
jgi:hypothetical protein